MRVELPPEAFDELVERVTARVLERLPAPSPVSPYMSINEAAEYLRCGRDDNGRVKRQRVYDLLSAGEIREHADLELAVDARHGAVFYRLLLSGEPLDDAFVDWLADQTLVGLG